MARYLHTMYRITDAERSRVFYEALGFEFRRDMDIVRNGEREATNYFFGMPGQEEELELTLNHDGRTYDVGTGYGHVAIAVQRGRGWRVNAFAYKAPGELGENQIVAEPRDGVRAGSLRFDGKQVKWRNRAGKLRRAELR